MTEDRISTVTDRREFLTLVSAFSAGALHPPNAVITVSAEPTVFHAHPEGRASLVRFIVTGADQSAGRLRVYDRRDTLIGTAGMLRAGDQLVGELWLPIQEETRLRSELEMPGTRTPIRTSHTVRPTPKWVVYWVTLTDPVSLGERLLALPPLHRSVEVARLVRAGVRGDPLPDVADPWLLDHLALMRLPSAAARLEARLGVPMSPAARRARVARLPYAALALDAVGVGGVVEADATPATLGFDRGRAEMIRRVGSWLAAMGPGTDGRGPRAVVVGGDLDGVDAMRREVEEWNTAYAYPRIVVELDETALRPATEVVAIPHEWPVDVTARELTELRDARDALVRRRLDETFSPLGRLIAPREPTLEGIGRAAALPARGRLVFNPSPFTRSGRDTLGGYATDVPALGYAWLPDPPPASGGGEGARRGETALTHGGYRIELDGASGHVRSLRDATGREWAHPLGLNAIEHARLDDTLVEAVPGGRALTARRITLRGAVTSTVTLYDSGETIELVNVSTVVGTDPLHYGFRLETPVRHVRWEVAGGFQSEVPPVRPGALQRWLALDGPDGSVVFAVPHTPAIAVDAEGAVTIAAADGRTRILLQTTAFPSEVEPWRLAWQTAPLVAVPAAGTGSVRVPTFGRSVGVDEPGVLVAGLKAADDGIGTIVYLQEVLGLAREVPLQGELLRFDAAFSCDLVERDRETLPLSGDSLVRVPLARFGFSAVRLLGLTLGR